MGFAIRKVMATKKKKKKKNYGAKNAQNKNINHREAKT
jgi:hypothetical protein